MVCFTCLPGREPGDPLTAVNAAVGAPGNFGSHWKMPPEELLELALRHHRGALSRNGPSGTDPN